MLNKPGQEGGLLTSEVCNEDYEAQFVEARDAEADVPIPVQAATLRQAEDDERGMCWELRKMAKRKGGASHGNDALAARRASTAHGAGGGGCADTGVPAVPELHAALLVEGPESWVDASELAQVTCGGAGQARREGWAARHEIDSPL